MEGGGRSNRGRGGREQWRGGEGEYSQSIRGGCAISLRTSSFVINWMVQLTHLFGRIGEQHFFQAQSDNELLSGATAGMGLVAWVACSNVGGGGLERGGREYTHTLVLSSFGLVTVRKVRLHNSYSFG